MSSMIKSDPNGASEVVGIMEPTSSKTVETTTSIKPGGNLETPDTRLSGDLDPSSKRGKTITSSACTSDGSPPKIGAIPTVLAASGSSVVDGPACVENEGNAQTESESPAKLQCNRRGRWFDQADSGQLEHTVIPANSDPVKEKENMDLKELEDCTRDNSGRHSGIDPHSLSINQDLDTSAGILGWAGNNGPPAYERDHEGQTKKEYDQGKDGLALECRWEEGLAKDD